ncbi:uncharacterized protein [Panulirus ornatus]|uniref:uncharacterized protein n=1 Tax=Panulirus ornatus TaxID=150431 RepID=UPI003A840372
MNSKCVLLVALVLDVVAGLVNDYSYYSVGPSYHSQASCLPKTYHLTHYETKTEEVPVYSTVYKSRVVPTTRYRTRHKTHYVTRYETKEVPRYVTQTTVKTLAEVVTRVQTKYSTRYRSRYITKTVSSHTTKTEYKSVYSNPETKTVYSTTHRPHYETKTHKEHVTHYVTKVIPQYQTVTETHRGYKIVCPSHSHRNPRSW